MTELKLKIMDKNHSTKTTCESGAVVTLVHTAPYEEGDMICLEAGKAGYFLWLQLDDASLPAFVYMGNNAVYYKIPFGEKRSVLSPKAFSGCFHLISARIADEQEIKTRKNLALNPYSGYTSPGLFPRADANVETRDEAVFAARNAIDGIFANESHGKFPYGSWGINRQDDAEWSLEFGREVVIDEIRITLRADYPHDNFWERVTVEFSDGSTERLDLRKTGQPQCFPIMSRVVVGLKLRDLQKSSLDSPFPSLTQFEALGCEK